MTPTLLVNFTRVLVHLWEESGIISAFSSLYDQVDLKIEQTWALRHSRPYFWVELSKVRTVLSGKTTYGLGWQ